MHKLNIFATSVLLATTPSMLAYPHDPLPRATFQVQKVYSEKNRAESDYIWSYDNILQLLDEIESGELEKKCSLEELARVKHFLVFLAKEGALDDNSEESLSLEDDIENLLNGEDPLYEDIITFVHPDEYHYMIVPAVLNGHGEVTLCKSWVRKQWKHVRKFAKKHKKALIIGTVVVVAATVVVVAVAVASSAAAGAAVASAAGAAGAVTASNNKSDKKDQKENVSADAFTTLATTNEAPTLKSTIDSQISYFKENIVEHQFFQSTNQSGSQQELSWQENGRALGSLFAHDSFNYLQNQIPYHSGLAQEIQDINSKYIFSVPGGNNGYSMGHPEIDRKFSTDLTHLYPNPGQEVDFNTLSYQVRGESALTHGYYEQAVQNFEKAIELNPNNPLPYLEKGIANFGLCKYDQSLDDYHQFASQTENTLPLSIPDFSLGFAKGLPKGIYESGRGILTFLSDVVVHPIHTGKQMCETFTLLSDLARSGEWSTLSEVLAPEIHQLVNEWETIPADKRGELAGYAFGKYGADILIPGTLAKATAKGLKGAQELSTVCRGLKTAEQTFLLESAAGLGNSTKIAEVVQLEKRISDWLGESTQVIHNKAGDPVFLSKDGLKKVRFDFNKPAPHESPHLHLEQLVDGEWQEISRVYPIDVPHK